MVHQAQGQLGPDPGLIPVIPVLGCPYINRPDLMERMLLSINRPLGDVVIIDNSPDASLPESYATVIRPGHNLGVAASWNRIIAEKPDAPWWAIVNSDIAFGPWDLAALAEHMTTVGGLALMQGFALFALDQATLDAVGTFDENFHPAYFEDNDFAYRATLAGVTITELENTLIHEGSAVIHSDKHYSDENGRTFGENGWYFHRKWGDYPHWEKFKTPFDAGGSIRDWTIDEQRLARQRWSMPEGT